MEGKVALGLGVLLLVAIVSMRIVSTTGARRGLALASVSPRCSRSDRRADVIRAEDRFGGFAVEETAK